MELYKPTALPGDGRPGAKAAAELETTAATMRLSDSMSKSTEVLDLQRRGGG